MPLVNKRLLLPLIAALAFPTAVNAFPWSSDIVVKTDLGEKYLVKESTVTVSAYSWDKRVTYLKDNINIGIRLFNPRCVDKSIGFLTDSDCKKMNREIESDKFMYNEAKKWIDKPTSLVKIKFKPIFIDLNNKKIAIDYETIYCFNPNLSSSDWVSIQIATSIRVIHIPNFVKVKNPLPFEITKSKVCEKYAKF